MQDVSFTTVGLEPVILEIEKCWLTTADLARTWGIGTSSIRGHRRLKHPRRCNLYVRPLDCVEYIRKWLPSYILW